MSFEIRSIIWNNLNATVFVNLAIAMVNVICLAFLRSAHWLLTDFLEAWKKGWGLDRKGSVITLQVCGGIPNSRKKTIMCMKAFCHLKVFEVFVYW